MGRAGAHCGSCPGGLRARAWSRITLMADIKFSCAHCGQHISCDEQWSGHQIQCPACQNGLLVPHLPPPAATLAPAAPAPVSQPAAPNRPRLAAGATQVARSTAPAPAARRQPVPRPPRTGNPILKFAMIAVVLAVIGGAGYLYLPGLLNHVQDMGTPKTPAPANASSGGSGPLGEVNGAMDISDTLDGSAPSRPPPPRAAPAQQPAAAKPPAAPATNSTPKSARRRPH
jgi:DNA-directed RNA polymerase subunit RPC12/RpoP